MGGKGGSVILVLGILLAWGMLFAPGEASADSRFFLVDGDDLGNSVTAALGNTTLYDFGIYSGGLFSKLLGPMQVGSFSYKGGEAPNFALDLGGGIYLTLFNDDAAVTYLGPIIAQEYSQNPLLSDDYWTGASIAWNIAAPNITVEITISHPHDGVYPVPLPTTLLLLGSGLVALVGFKRRHLNP